MLAQNLVEYNNGRVPDVEMAGHTPQGCDVQVAAPLIEACHLALLQLFRRIRHKGTPVYIAAGTRVSLNIRQMQFITALQKK